MKKLKSEAKTKKIKSNDARSGGDDDMDARERRIRITDARSAAPKKAAVPAAAPQEPTVEVAKEAESELPLADRLLGSGVRPPHRMDFQLQVKYLFAVGSPLAVFLVMRGATHADLLPSKMNVERVFNIFHPYDPVAYRLEPMFIPEFRYIRPIKLFSSHDLRARGSYDELPLDVYKSYMKKLKSEAKTKKIKSNDARSGGDDDMDEEDDCDSDYDAKSGSAPKKAAVPAAAPQEPTVEVAKEAESELPLADRLLGSGVRPPHRMDFQLQPALTDKSYWSVLKSHFAYWTNADLAVFVANLLHTEYQTRGDNDDATEAVDHPTFKAV
ncbi:DDHD domain protein [Cooperia oncophora]